MEYVQNLRLPFISPAAGMLKDFFKDGRHFQIVFLSLFLIVGISMLEWEINPLNVVVTFSACILFQFIGSKILGQPISSLKSAWISALSITLMMKATYWWVFVLAALLSISGKFLIRRDNKHVFNPTNFGIVLTVLLSGNAWVSPGQWGSQFLWWAFIGIAGLTVLFRVGRWDTAFAFLGTLAVLDFTRYILFLGWPADFFLHQFTSGTLLVFTFFMITDPVTTPNHRAARMIWAMLVACLSFILSWKFFVVGAPIYALFILSAFTPLFDNIFKSKKFKWNAQ